MLPLNKLGLFILCLGACKSTSPALKPVNESIETSQTMQDFQLVEERQQSSGQSKKVWNSWDEVASDLLIEANKTVTTKTSKRDIQLAAFDFCLEHQDYSRAEWLNGRWTRSQDPRQQAIGAYNEGRIAAQLGQYDRTEELWQKALLLDPESSLIRKKLGLLYANFGFFAKSLSLLKDYEVDPVIAMSLVAVERQLGLNEQADRHCEKLLATPKPLAMAFYNCSLLEFQNHRNAARAILWMNQARQNAKQNSDLQNKAQAQLILMQEWKARFQADR